MKHLFIILFVMMLFPVYTYGQKCPPVDIDETAATYEFTMPYGRMVKKEEPTYKQTVYWRKHKRLKRCAFSALGLGICGTFIGCVGVLYSNSYTTSNWNDGKAWDVVLGTGIGLTVSSIPLFIISHKNKKKAKEAVTFSLRSSNIYLTEPNGVKKAQSAVGVCINF